MHVVQTANVGISLFGFFLTEAFTFYSLFYTELSNQRKISVFITSVCLLHQNTRMRTEQLSDPSISSEIAAKLARFHLMVMPFNKEPKWLFGTIDRLVLLFSICIISMFKLNVCAVVFAIMFRYLAQVMKLSFVREAHVKKYKKLMKLDLPTELQSLR